MAYEFVSFDGIIATTGPTIEGYRSYGYAPLRVDDAQDFEAGVERLFAHARDLDKNALFGLEFEFRDGRLSLIATAAVIQRVHPESEGANRCQSECY